MKFILKFFGYRRLAMLLAVLLGGALLDLAGIFILFPYIQLASKPAEAIGKLRLGPWLERLHIQDTRTFVLAVGAGLIAFYSLKMGLVYLFNRHQARTTADLSYRLTTAMYARLLSCRYAIFQAYPGSMLIAMVYNYPFHAILCLTASVTILNDVLFLLMILAISLAMNPLLTLAAVITLATVGVVLQFAVVRKTHLYGKQQVKFEDAKHKLTFATVNAIKDIKVMGIEPHMREENLAISKGVQDNTWRFNTLGTLPKSIIEYTIFVVLCVAVYVFLGIGREPDEVLPALGVGIAGVLRIVPSFTRIFASLNSFKFYRPGIDKINEFYAKTAPFQVDVIDEIRPFEHKLEARNIGFAYGEKRVLTGVSIEIEKGKSIGIVGMSGSGKSTLLDLISGIQEKQEGEFFLDGLPVDPFHANSIRRMLGYVPQTIALVDESIAFNVSFSRNCVPEKLHRALKVANLLDFVDQLPEKEATMVGENGVRLSGGQRQRIGIARALYKDPEILIFDEATSAVDNITEQELTREIRNLAGSKTLIMVAHRLTTIMHCDRIYILGGGKVIGAGTYQELLEGNAFFQELNRQSAVEKPA